MALAGEEALGLNRLPTMSLGEAGSAIDAFAPPPALTSRIGQLEVALRGQTADGATRIVHDSGLTSTLLQAVLVVKAATGQINVILHAIGLLLVLPLILEPGETVQSVSLGAGNTGRDNDLVTDRRIAEFKFIGWRGGPESIRQNVLFVDFVRLVASPAAKRRQLYVIGTEHPLRFLRGGRAIDSVLSRDARMATLFKELYGDKYRRVGQYFADHADQVELADLVTLVPELAGSLAQSG